LIEPASSVQARTPADVRAFFFFRWVFVEGKDCSVSTRSSSSVFVLLLMLVVAAPAGAQTAAPATPQVTAGWRDGFYVQSEKGDFRLQIGALVHADGRFALGDDDETVNDTFLIRRLRPFIRGRFAQRFEFYLNPDFAGGTLVVQDAYIDTVFSPAFRLRAGKAKSPFGLERLQSAGNMLFLERALPTSLVPNRDVGIQVLGDLAGGVIGYQAGVLNGVADGGSGDTDASDSKDVAGRVVIRPFTKQPASVLRGLSVGIAATSGRQSGAAALPAFRTASVQQPYFSYSGAVADGVRNRYSPQLTYFHKAFGGLVEYVHSEIPVRKGTIAEDIGHDSWQVAGSWVLTGEAATDASAGIRPRANFDFGAGHYGAFQVAARYHALTVDEPAFALNFATAGASRKAEAWTAGLNWYLTPNFKYVINFERTVFDDGADDARRPENAFVFRTQINF
jgi:phosphate-selective porin OprO and OprP